MPVYLVRHAKAGSRSLWDGPDESRPLSNGGWNQAHRLAEALAAHPVPRILSSPYLRCVQTVEPLARRLNLPVEPVEALAEGQPFEPVLDLLDGVADHTVLCSHGDLVPDAVNALVRRGMVVEGEPDWRKAVIWVLTRNGGRFVHGRAIPPPP